MEENVLNENDRELRSTVMYGVGWERRIYPRGSEETSREKKGNQGNSINECKEVRTFQKE